MLSRLTSFFYNTPSLESIQGNAHYVLPAKAIFTHKNVDEIKLLNWTFSKRLNIVIYEDKIFVGNQEISIENIKSAECYKLRSIFNIMVYSAVKLKLSDNNFSLSWNK